MLYVCNIDEDSIEEDNDHVKAVREFAAKEGASVVKICGKMESEIAQLETEEEKKACFKALDDAHVKGGNRHVLSRLATLLV